MSLIDRSRPILVFLAGGVQGGAVLRAACSRGFHVRALVRDTSRAAGLRAPGVDLAAADLDDAASLQAACRGVGQAVLQIPTGSTAIMAAQAERALAALVAERVGSIVLKLASASRPEPCEELSLVANARIEAITRRSGLPLAVVRPTLYLDNLLKPSARADLVRAGVFAPPIGATQRIAWTSADDCAEASLMLLERGVDGGDYRIAGPESLTGEELADRITSGLGRPVTYRPQSIDAFEQDVDAAFGAGVGSRVAAKFRYFAGHPSEAETILARPFRPEAGLADFRPTDVETWVRRNRMDILGEDSSLS